MHRSRRSLVALLALAAALLAPACASLPRAGSPAIAETWGFTAPWDPRSAASVRAHAAQMDAVVFGWLALDSTSGHPLEPYTDTLARSAPAALRRMAIVTTFGGGHFHPELIRRLAVDSAALERASVEIADRARRDGYGGLVLDFEEAVRADTAAMRAAVAAIARTAHSRGIEPVVVALVAADTMAYPARLFDSADLLMPMLYDQHWSTSAPGAIAAPDWVRRTLAMRVAESGATRLVAALPLYGYLWQPGSAAATISYDDARRFAAEANVPFARDTATATMHAITAGSDSWELWVSDAALLAELRRIVAELGVRRVAYWRLGLEDGKLWER